MKTYSIGREENCNIIISDPSKMVSRHHATLNVDGTKMTIMDHSSNGTFINGIKITSNTPVPVTRRDIVSFANVSDLDWNRIPNPAKKIVTICFSIVIGIAVLVGATYYVVQHKEDKKDEAILAEENRAKETEKMTNEIKQFKVDLDSLQSVHKEDKKDEAILAEENRAKETEKMTNEIKQFKVDLDSLQSVHKTISDRLVKINKECDTKADCKELKEVTKSIGNVESDVKNVDLQALKNSIERVEENLKDNVPDTPSRVQNVAENIKKYKNILSKASETLDQIEDKLKNLKNKAATPSKKDKEKKQEEPDDTIMNPIIYM